MFSSFSINSISKLCVPVKLRSDIPGKISYKVQLIFLSFVQHSLLLAHPLESLGLCAVSAYLKFNTIVCITYRQPDI